MVVLPRSLMSSIAGRTLLLAGMTAAIATPRPAGAQTFTLGVRIDHAAPTAPAGIALAHFDTDGKLDLAVANPGHGTVSVQRGDGTGGFGPRTAYVAGSGSWAIAPADLNRDGRLDLVVTNYGAHTVSVFPGKAQAQFGTRQDFPTGMTPRAVAIGDVNLDSHLDLAVANAGANTVSILLADGIGGFGTKTDFATGDRPEHLAIADMNGDGRPDLVTANYDDSSISVLLGLGDGQFGPKADTPTGTHPRTLAVGDVFFNDGKLDVATIDEFSSAIIHIGDGLGGFSNLIGYPASPGLMAIADLNTDGSVDLAVGCDTTQNLEVLTGDGSGYAPSLPTPVGGRVRSIAIADLNGDGGLDIVVSTEAVNKVSVLLAQRVVVGPATDFATGDAPGSVALGDINDDQNLDLAVSNFVSDSVSVFLGNGVGGFGARTPVAVGNGPVGIRFADVSAEGNLDLIVPNQEGNTVSVLLGNGLGGFGPKTDYGTGFLPTNVAIADVSGDGKVDLAVSNWAGDAVSILLGNGTGGFSPRTDFPAGTNSNPIDVKLARMNADAHLDLVTADYGTSTVSILPGDGSGSFGAGVHTTLDGRGFGLDVGDLNGDGLQDVAVATNSSLTPIAVLIGDGLGGFADISTVFTNLSTTAVTITDMNHDTRPDLVVVNQGGPSVSLALGNGAGRFGPDLEFPTGSDLGGVAVGDLDHNGRLDLVYSTGSEDEFSVRLGRAPTRLALTASPNPVAFNGALTLTATVTVPPPGTGPVTGLVHFHDGSTSFGAVPPINGVATLQIAASFPWFRTYHAAYTGNGRLFGSVAPGLDLMVFVQNVGVPPSTAPLAFALEGVRPNPAPRGRLRVHFSLPTEAPARLELFDVRGRRVTQQEVQGQGSGLQVVDLAEQGPIPAGVYFVRLTQGADARVARAVILE